VDSDRLRGQRVVLVDDSLVRGTTLERVVKKVREAGVQEIHVRIASPPVIYPDFYGLGLPDQKELLAVRHTERDLAKHFAVDSFSFLQIERIYQVFNTIFSENCSSIQFADHYFTGHYPDTQSSLLKHVA
jgi:amidophosphoribosyltransferase